ncbi:MAG: hypothetical protein P1U58_06930 [Verrucomicrobiales bacterium]|nr:hypothetical protein [Verrucomicrobiales bacterium]
MNYQRWLFLLKLCVSVTLVARGWLTWQWDSPIRGLVWHEDWWSSLLEKTTDLTWTDFALASDPWINQGLMVFGILLIVGGILPWFISKSCCPWTRWLLWPLAGLLLIDSFARWVSSDYEFGMAIEHALQMITPIALFFVSGKNPAMKRWCLLVSIAAAMTFIGHGCYAAGIHPVPLSYQNMTIGILGVSQDTALILLAVAGWLDILFAIGIFFRQTRMLSLCYLVLWGAATAAARVVAHIDLGIDGWALNPWAFETMVRTSHWLLPLLLLLLYRFRIEPARSEVKRITQPV